MRRTGSAPRPAARSAFAAGHALLVLLISCTCRVGAAYFCCTPDLLNARQECANLAAGVPNNAADCRAILDLQSIFKFGFPSPPLRASRKANSTPPRPLFVHAHVQGLACA